MSMEGKTDQRDEFSVSFSRGELKSGTAMTVEGTSMQTRTARAIIIKSHPSLYIVTIFFFILDLH